MLHTPTLAALASPRRREILRLVWDEERSAGEIRDTMPDVTFGAVSLAFLFWWDHARPKQGPLRLLPGPLVVVVIAGFALGHASLRPIFALKRATDALATGDLTSRVAATTSDEIGELSTAFMEGLNSVFSAVKRKARGYRNPDYLITMLYFVAGKLSLPSHPSHGK